MTDARLTGDGDAYVTTSVRWRDDYEPRERRESDREPTVDEDTATDLRRLLDALEAVNWRDVPSVSCASVAVFAKLIELALPEEVSDK